MKNKSLNYLKQNQGEQGITIIEVMIGITIMFIVIIPILNILSSFPVIIKNNELKQKAVLLAQKKMEEVMVISYDNLEEEIGTVVIENENHNFKQKVMVNTIDSYGGNDVTNVKEITVEISWDEPQKLQFKKRKFNNN